MRDDYDLNKQNDDNPEHEKVKREIPYFDMGEAWNEVRQGFDAKEKSMASLKLFGKGLFNAGKFLATNAPKAVDTCLSYVESSQKDRLVSLDKQISKLEKKMNEIQRKLKSHQLDYETRELLESYLATIEMGLFVLQQKKDDLLEAQANFQERQAKIQNRKNSDNELI